VKAVRVRGGLAQRVRPSTLEAQRAAHGADRACGVVVGQHAHAALPVHRDQEEPARAVHLDGRVATAAGRRRAHVGETSASSVRCCSCPSPARLHHLASGAAVVVAAAAVSVVLVAVVVNVDAVRSDGPRGGVVVAAHLVRGEQEAPRLGQFQP
jgi:hypothetical protein